MLKGLNETIELINTGKKLHIAADEKLLAKLPKGNWIGGTTPYFMAEKGGLITDEKLFVNVFDDIVDFKICTYDIKTIKNVAIDAFDNGFTLLILPFGSKILELYAKDAPNIEQVFMKNIAGWVSGFNLGNTGETAKTVSGRDLKFSDSTAVAMHIRLSDDKLATIGIINIFEPNENSPSIVFPNDSFDVQKCVIDGKETNLADYIEKNKIDTKLPLVSNYSGSNINISIKEISGEVVKLYAPVFKGRTYKFAKKIDNYTDEFKNNIMKNKNANTIFSCNCILNFLYGQLEGKSTAPFFGQVTFGEIAYQLVNQTLVYIDIQ